jgi:hypothetical protein
MTVVLKDMNNNPIAGTVYWYDDQYSLNGFSDIPKGGKEVTPAGTQLKATSPGYFDYGGYVGDFAVLTIHLEKSESTIGYYVVGGLAALLLFTFFKTSKYAR